ncbi:MAG: universal stress protein [Anaerolineales bacterium]|nr:universal stress protein [Anaerolineales bacterium]MCS7248042.1 universal stress protein [Anaerolineales bacterium]MDW8161854.1 universal stress protein [Anaerolineales bacterium]MDW8446914.1 universal stress protein [Anaerolineales bacterium]
MNRYFQPTRRALLNSYRGYFSILLADDGSPDVLAAVDLLVDLPLYHCTVTALSVVSQREAGSLALREACLDQTRSRLEQAEICAHTILKGGSPAEVILQVAEELSPHLVVMGATGLNHAFGILLGGVAERVVERIRLPILIYRHPYRGLRKIGFFTDGSTQAEWAAKYLGQFPLPDEAEIYVVHVLPPLSIHPILKRRAFQSLWPGGNGKAREISLRDADEILHKATSILQKHGLPTRAVLLYGDPYEQIRDYISRAEIDLAVLGAQGLSKGEEWELGSLPRKLLHYCPCPTLIVKRKPGLLSRIK